MQILQKLEQEELARFLSPGKNTEKKPFFKKHNLIRCFWQRWAVTKGYGKGTDGPFLWDKSKLLDKREEDSLIKWARKSFERKKAKG